MSHGHLSSIVLAQTCSDQTDTGIGGWEPMKYDNQILKHYSMKYEGVKEMRINQ